MWLPPEEASIQKSRREGKAESIALKVSFYGIAFSLSVILNKIK
jgi:hypothetical protein